MTTPPTPAGWYPDPDGSGGQRYWDGSAWTEHRSPAAHPTPEPSEPPAAPVAPASPAEPQRSEEPTVVVPTRNEPQGTDQPTVVVRHEPPASPAEQPTVVVPLRPAPPEEHVGAHRAPEPEPHPGPPPGFTAPSSGPPNGPPAPGDNRKLIMWFSAACAALLAVLVLVVIYGVFIQDDEPVQIASPTSSPAPTTEDTTATETSAPGWGEPTGPPTETDAPIGGETVDGPLSFAVTGVETGTTVSSTDAPVEKTAQGEYIIVRMSVINTSDAPAQFLGTLQKLHAGGTTYTIDDEATFYVGGGFVEIPPGGEVVVGVAYDVPPGTVAESIELHTDPLSPGVRLPL
jgi:hypothetical protein